MQSDAELFKRLNKGLNILFVKGSSDGAEEEQKLLGQFFEHMEIVQSAENALKIHEVGRFDIIYTPISLAGMNGIELIKNIKNYDKNQKFIVFIDKKESHHIFDLLKLNISLFIAKPLAMENFLYITDTAIGSAMHVRQSNIDIQQTKLAQTGEMISMIAHQWRQPLSAITTIVGTIRTRMDLDVYKRSDHPYEALESDLQDAFVRIEDSAEYLSKTINDFRDYYRTENKISSFNAGEMIESVCRMALLDNAHQNIEVQFDKDDTIVLTTVENELKQVLINIINNAKDVMIENSIKKPKLRLSLKQGEGLVYINVVDNGGGIPEAIVEQIFLPYFSTKSKKNGTGIGLHMSKIIIENHIGGSLTVTNNELFGGADFCITLPITAKETTV